VFRWAPATELGSLRFEPAGLASVLHNLDGTLRHLVLDGEDGWPPQGARSRAQPGGPVKPGSRATSPSA
jgi:hypothetical protein